MGNHKVGNLHGKVKEEEGNIPEGKEREKIRGEMSGAVMTE